MNSSSSVKPTITNPISNVLGTTTTKSASSMIGSTTTTTSGSFFSNMSWTTIILLILFFFFFGFGIFVYLAKGTESAVEFITKLFVTVLQKIMHLFGNDSVDFSKEDTTSTTTTTSSTQPSTTTNTQIEKHMQDDHGVPGKSVTQPSTTTNTQIEKHMQDDHGVPGKSVTQPNAAAATSSEAPKDTTKQDSLNKALSSAKPNLTHKNEPDYSADDSYSSIQMSKSTSKSGWCFIGEDRGFRSCIQLGDNDRCMSGDIFPSQEICINPSLRP
jgi:hypothetical protein